MIKQIQVTFDFNTETEEVSNVKVVGSTEKKKTTTKKAKDIVVETATEAIITLEANKLVFNSKAVELLEVEAGDRVNIKWMPLTKAKNSELIPIIEKGDEENGNKLTKSNTIAYKGKANTVLAEKGSEFTMVAHGEGLWKLVSTSDEITSPENTTLEDAIEAAQEFDPDLIVSSDDTDEIEMMDFKF